MDRLRGLSFSSCVHLVGNLNAGAASAASRCADVSEGAAIYPVLVSQIASHDKQRDAGQKEAHQAIQTPALTHLVRVRVSLARKAK